MIDRLLVRNERGNRRIAARFGLAETSLRRHRGSHLPKALMQAQAAGAVVQGDELLLEVQQLQERAQGRLEAAEDAGDLRSACAAIREARGCLELLAKLLGELQASPTVNLVVSPEWIAARTRIVRALEPFPEARQAVARALVAAGPETPQ